MTILSEEGIIPEEHFARKESTAEDDNMDKTLTFDLSRISKTLMTNVSLDAENCLDRITHVILMLIWYVLLNDWMLVTMFLEVIGHMRLYQRTGYGDSQTFVRGKDLPRPFQGKGQGSGASAAWIIFVRGFPRPSPTQSLEACLGRWVDSLWMIPICTSPWIPTIWILRCCI